MGARSNDTASKSSAASGRLPVAGIFALVFAFSRRSARPDLGALCGCRYRTLSFLPVSCLASLTPLRRVGPIVLFRLHSVQDRKEGSRPACCDVVRPAI